KLGDAYQFQKEIDDAIESALPSLVAPFIESPVVTNITDSSATVSWRTNIKAYGAISYAKESAYDSTKVNPYTTDVSDLDTKEVTHTLQLQNLSADTVYHFAVKGYTLPQVIGSTKDATFVTKALNIQAQINSIGNSSFKASWRTGEPTTSVVSYR